MNTLVGLEIAILSLFGAGWRWWHGRGFCPRWARLVALGVVVFLATLEPLGPVGASVITALMVANFVVGYTDWEDPLIMTIRYTVASCLLSTVLMVVTINFLWWAYILVGPAVAIVYWCVMVQWPSDESNEIAETFLGAAFIGPLGVLWL